MSGLSDELEQHIISSSTNGSSLHQHHSTPPTLTTMPSLRVNVRNPMGRAHLPHPRPTVSLDPRPVVIPILSSVIGFPILVFALICALRHRAIKLRRKDHIKKMQSGHRSVTLDLPARDKISFFSGGSSPEVSMREASAAADRFAIQPTFTSANTAAPQGILQTRTGTTSRNNNHVKFVTPATTLDASHTMKVEVVLHHIATSAAESIGAEVHSGGQTSGSSESSSSPKMMGRIIETGVELDSSDSDSPR